MEAAPAGASVAQAGHAKKKTKLSDAERKARRARAQKEWVRATRAHLNEQQVMAVKDAMAALKAGAIETPAFCAAALAIFQQVQDEAARVTLVRAMALLVPPKFRSLYHQIAAGRVVDDVDQATEGAAAAASPFAAAEIQPGLFLGGWDTVQSADALRARGITSVLTVGPEELVSDEVRNDSSFKQKVVVVNDMPQVDLMAHFDVCADFISEGSVAGGVLVHCWAGQSRSVAVVCAYLLRQRLNESGQGVDPGSAVDAALQHVRDQGRPAADPNSGFLEQLHWFAAITGGHRRERASAELAYRVFRMEAIRREYGTLMLEMLPPEVTAATSRVDVDTIYRCRGCREVIFTSDNVLPHSSGEGQTAFSWYRRDRSRDVVDTACNTLHLEPMTVAICIEIYEFCINVDGFCIKNDDLNTNGQWMGIVGTYEVQGKLKCSCGQKLGSFHWAGMQCSCGAWVTPAFAVGKSKVDVVGNQTLAVAAAPRQTGPATAAVVSAGASGGSDLGGGLTQDAHPEAVTAPDADATLEGGDGYAIPESLVDMLGGFGVTASLLGELSQDEARSKELGISSAEAGGILSLFQGGADRLAAPVDCAGLAQSKVPE